MVTRLRLHRAAAATLITILSFAIVLGPATWLGVSLIATIGFFVDQLNTGAIAIPPPPQLIKDWPFIGEAIFEFWDLASTNIKAAFTELSPLLKPLGPSLLKVSRAAPASTRCNSSRQSRYRAFSSPLGRRW